ncbi:MAG: hypothetical protein U0271_43525 [Polyangiaceae bacterium]
MPSRITTKRWFHKKVQVSLALLALFAIAIAKPQLSRADEDEDPGFGPSTSEPDGKQADFSGSLQIVRAPGVSASSARFGVEIFPESSRVFMGVRDTDPVPIERARRGGPWACSKANCQATAGVTGASREGDWMLRSIKIQTPNVPLPVTIWRNSREGGKLLFDPVLLGRRSYAHLCAYPPTVNDDGASAKKDPNKIELCKDGQPAAPSSDSADILLGLEWPRKAELAGFRYLAIVDSCGNARVQPFQRSFTVPVFEVASGGCGRPDGKVLRVFPTGGFIRVTAFNLDAPASEDVMNVTYRVTVPPLENYSDADPPQLLFPDIKLNDLRIDCGPVLRRTPSDGSGVPRKPGSGGPPMGTPPTWIEPQAPQAPVTTPQPVEPKPEDPKPEPVPGEEPVDEPAPEDGARLDAPATPPGGPPPTGQPVPAAGPPPSATSGTPPGATPPGATPPGAMPPGGMPPGAKAGPTPTVNTAVEQPSGPSSKPLDHGTLVIAPEPLQQGNCRLVMTGQQKWRLTAPLALHVGLYRTDKPSSNEPVNLIPRSLAEWIVTPSDYEFAIPAVKIDGDSRLKIVVHSDPFNRNGKVILVGDAGRVTAIKANIEDQGYDRDDRSGRRMIGSATIHSVPLCGEKNFETLEEAGSCMRAYLTIPTMLATLQITRAPWIEKPLISRNLLSSIGIALALDSYDPVERSAFPIAAQIGGFFQNLTEDKLALMAYVGIAPTLPILGQGGNTTTFGFLAGLGMSYIFSEKGPDEGFKPTAFISIVVQVGQANPEMSMFGGNSSAGGSASFNGED